MHSLSQLAARLVQRHISDDDYKYQSTDVEWKMNDSDEKVEQQSTSNSLTRCQLFKRFLKPRSMALLRIAMRVLSFLDMFTDIVLLLKASASGMLSLTVSLFLSIVAPYLLQYSCGIKLFTNRRVFQNFRGLKSILVVLFLSPFGVMSFVFLEVFDSVFSIFVIMQLIICCRTNEQMNRIEEILASQMGLDRMNWEGLIRQRQVAQLIFETIPQVHSELKTENCFQCLCGVLYRLLYKFCGVFGLSEDWKHPSQPFIFQYPLVLHWSILFCKLLNYIWNQGLCRKIFYITVSHVLWQGWGGFHFELISRSLWKIRIKRKRHSYFWLITIYIIGYL